VVTDRHTDTHTQTNAGENIFARYRGDSERSEQYLSGQTKSKT